MNLSSTFPVCASLIVCASPLLWTAPAHAATTLDANGFTVRQEITVKVAPAAAFDAFIDHIGDWWNGEHSYSGNAHNLSIERKAGGCFCENLPDGGGVQHMRVVYLAPAKALTMTGALGPMQSSGLSGAMSLEFQTVPEGTRIKLQYALGGHFEGGFGKIAPAVDNVLAEQLGRYQRYLERGKPD